MEETTKCAHPACKCQVPKDSKFGKFCSEHCQMAKDLTEIHCDCLHPNCK